MSETEDEYRTKEDEYRTKEDESVTEDEAELFDSDTEDEPESYVNSEAADADADSEDESALEAQLKRKYSFTLYIPLRHHRLWEEINNLPAVAEEKRKGKKYKYALRKALQDLKVTASDFKIALNYFKALKNMRGEGFIRYLAKFFPKQWHAFVGSVWRRSGKHVRYLRKNKSPHKRKLEAKPKSPHKRKLKAKPKRKTTRKRRKRATQGQTRGVQTQVASNNAMSLLNDVITSFTTAMNDRWDTDVERIVKLSLIKMLCDVCSKPSVIDLERSSSSNATGPSRSVQFIFRAVRLGNASTGRAPRVLWRRQSDLFECATFVNEALCRCVLSSLRPSLVLTPS